MNGKTYKPYQSDRRYTGSFAVKLRHDAPINIIPPKDGAMAVKGDTVMFEGEVINREGEGVLCMSGGIILACFRHEQVASIDSIEHGRII